MIFIQDAFGAEQQYTLFCTEQSEMIQSAAENQQFVTSLVVERCIFIYLK